MWTSLWRQTEREKQGALDGLNLFFGALLGADLGTLDASLSGERYVILIALLAAVVMIIRQFSTSERRMFIFFSFVTVVGIIGSILFLPNGTLSALPPLDRERLGITFAVWMATVVLVEFAPTIADPAKPKPEAT